MARTVAVAGLGAIGMRVAEGLDRGEAPGLRLTAVSAGDLDRAARRVAGFAHPPATAPVETLAEHADIIVECAPKAVFEPLARTAVEAGRIFVPLSVGALLDRPELIDRAAETGARILVPTGALIGLDVVRAMAVGEIREVRLQTRKPPKGLAGAPYLEANGVDPFALTEPTRVFEGDAREAARGFPANVNVAAALALAGIGPDRTRVEIWVDPTIDRNIQSVRIASDAAEAEMTIRNIPSATAATGKITALSVMALLQRLHAPLVAGT